MVLEDAVNGRPTIISGDENDTVLMVLYKLLFTKQRESEFLGVPVPGPPAVREDKKNEANNRF